MPTVLVVEDETLIAQIVIAILGDAGYQTSVAANGKEALHFLESSRPDLIISDVMMPVMDGREFLRRLSAHSDYSSIPVVLMSAAFGSIDLDGYTHAAFLRKPFDVDALVRTVDGILGEGAGAAGPVE